MWNCPNCANEIDYLKYSVDTRETGSVNICNNSLRECDTEDFESEDNEWQGSVDYYCPECDESINLGDLTPTEEEKEEKEEEKEELEEEKHNIIKPELELQIEKNNIDQTENTMICKHCFYVFAYSNEYMSKEEFVDCPNCGKQNNGKEYKQLINNRFFEKVKIKKLRKKYAKKTNG